MPRGFCQLGLIYVLLTSFGSWGCVADLGVESTARLVCAADTDCPKGWACNLALEPESDRGRCLESAGTDHEAPGLEAGPEVTPPVARLGTEVMVRFSSNEALGTLPSLILSVAGIEPVLRSGQAFEAGRFEFSFVIDTPLAETSIDVDARLVDTAGNAVVVDVGSVALDFDAPAASNIAWDLEGRTTIRDNETLRLSAEMSVDTQTAQLILLGDGVSELLRIPLLVDADGTGAAVFDLRNVDTLPWTTLSAQLSLEDAAGNTNDSTQDTAPDLTFDRLPPAVQIDAAPAVTSQQTQPTFEFSNAQGDIASIQCSLDGAQFVDCSSPWQLPELSLGEHRFEIISTDAAGNPQETPTVHVWTIDRHWRWVAAGSSHTCAIATDDSLWCWGKVTDGAIGAGIGETTLPVQVTAPERWRAVAAGAHNTCGIALDGTLWCWGSDSDGQLGIGGAMLADDLRVAPVQVGGESDWMTVSVGNASTCGIRGQTQGTLWCWGSLAGAATPQAIEAPVTDWLNIVVREGHACGIRNDSGARSAWCWGSGRNGELGFLPQAIGQATPSTSVDTTGVSGGWLQVAVGVQHSCGVTTTGELWCWGSDPQGQIGNGPGDSTEQETPTRIGSDSDWTAVVSNTNANCGLRGRSVFCWGENNHGGVDRTTVGTNAVAPIAPSNAPSDVVQLSVGSDHTCAIDRLGVLTCWGYNAFGQVGTAPVQTAQGTLQQVGSASDWSDIAAGVQHTCGIRSGGQLWCWGRNDDYEFGDTTTLPAEEPRQVIGNNDWLAVTAGTDFSCGIRSGGGTTAWCWGDNSFGQTEASSSIAHSTQPAQVGSVGGWSSIISAGDRHACAIWQGQVWCWGNNLGGSLGCGACAAGATYTEVRAGSDNDWTALDAGSQHTCGVRSNGGQNTAHCWGFSLRSQAGRDSSFIGSPEVIDDDVGSTITGWTGIATGDGFSCGTKSSSIQCWGTDTSSVGVFGASETSVPRTVVNIGAASIDAGWGHVCAVRSSDGGAFCWGRNDFGQLGSGAGSVSWSKVSTGRNHSCGVGTDGTLWCWGDNSWGQLGIGGIWAPPTQVAWP